MRIIIRASRCFDGVETWLVEEMRHGKYRVVQPIEMKLSEEEYDSGFLLPDPTFKIPRYKSSELIKSLMDALVMENLIPDPSMERGELKAMKEHLKDLQKYVDRLLK